MNKGAFVLIFLLRALITVITPTLVQWSFAEAQAQQATSYSQDKLSDLGRVKARRMLVLLDEISVANPPAQSPSLHDSDILTPLPSPESQQPSNQSERFKSTIEITAQDRYLKKVLES